MRARLFWSYLSEYWVQAPIREPNLSKLLALLLMLLLFSRILGLKVPIISVWIILYNNLLFFIGNFQIYLEHCKQPLPEQRIRFFEFRFRIKSRHQKVREVFGVLSVSIHFYDVHPKMLTIIFFKIIIILSIIISSMSKFLSFDGYSY